MSVRKMPRRRRIVRKLDGWYERPPRALALVGALIFFIVAVVLPVAGMAWFLFASFMALLEWLGLLG